MLNVAQIKTIGDVMVSERNLFVLYSVPVVFIYLAYGLINIQPKNGVFRPILLKLEAKLDGSNFSKFEITQPESANLSFGVLICSS